MINHLLTKAFQVSKPHEGNLTKSVVSFTVKRMNVFRLSCHGYDEKKLVLCVNVETFPEDTNPSHERHHVGSTVVQLSRDIEVILISLRDKEFKLPFSRNLVYFQDFCLIKFKIKRFDVDDVWLAQTSFATLPK